MKKSPIYLLHTKENDKEAEALKNRLNLYYEIVYNKSLINANRISLTTHLLGREIYFKKAKITTVVLILPELYGEEVNLPDRRLISPLEEKSLERSFKAQMHFDYIQRFASLVLRNSLLAYLFFLIELKALLENKGIRLFVIDGLLSQVPDEEITSLSTNPKLIKVYQQFVLEKIHFLEDTSLESFLRNQYSNSLSQIRDYDRLSLVINTRF